MTNATHDTEVRDLLMEILRDVMSETIYAELERAHVESYQDAGVLTSDEGFVLRLGNGAEFQVTIVRSR